METSNPNAEYGSFGGAIINLAIKSGTNGFHGEACRIMIHANTHPPRVGAHIVDAVRGGAAQFGDYKIVNPAEYYEEVLRAAKRLLGDPLVYERSGTAAGCRADVPARTPRSSDQRAEFAARLARVPLKRWGQPRTGRRAMRGEARRTRLG